MAGSFALQGPKVPRFNFRPLILVTLATVAYGYLMKPLGIVGATAALVYISALGGHEFKWKEVTILFAALIVASILVFVKGLTLPFPICPDFIANCPIH
jgi:putative tricarboxylic transport membrane protein